MDQAKAGKDALDTGNYNLAVDLYTSAIKSTPTAVDYYIQRSIAYTRLKETDNDPAASPTPDYQAALKDTEAAVLLAYKRQKKELIQRSQLRRAIALANLNRLGDADFVLKICRNLHGPATYKKPETDNPALEMWEKRVQIKMSKLPPNDEQLKVTVTEKPEEQLETAITTATVGTEQKEASDKAKAKEETIKAGVTQNAKDIRHDFYQSNDMVTLTVYAKYVPKESVVHEIKEDSVSLFPQISSVPILTRCPSDHGHLPHRQRRALHAGYRPSIRQSRSCQD
jgi:suppressor of G2 allele of SKP1